MSRVMKRSNPCASRRPTRQCGKEPRSSNMKAGERRISEITPDLYGTVPPWLENGGLVGQFAGVTIQGNDTVLWGRFAPLRPLAQTSHVLLYYVLLLVARGLVARGALLHRSSFTMLWQNDTAPHSFHVTARFPS